MTSLLQVGFLWVDFNNTLPFSSLARITAEPQPSGVAADAPASGAVLLNPFKMFVCDGNETHYRVNRASDVFAQLAGMGQGLFEEILTQKPAADPIPRADWPALVSAKRGFLLWYHTPVQRDAALWAVNLGAAAQEAPGEVQRLLVVPEEPGGEGAVMLYALTGGDILCYRSYIAPFEAVRDAVANAINAALQDADAPRFKTVAEFGGASFSGYAPDVACVVDGGKARIFPGLHYSAPSDTGIRDKTALDHIILGNDIYSYNRSVDYSDTFVFKNTSNIYRLYQNGFMEYNYTPAIHELQKGAMAEALANALNFVYNIEQQLLGSASLYLSGVYEDESGLSYRFTFDYILDDYPVYFNYRDERGDMVYEYANAITVQANGERVVSCQWMLVDLFFGSAGQRLLTYFETIDVGQDLLALSVSDINVAYRVDLNAGADAGTALWPMWAIEQPGGGLLWAGMEPGPG